MFVIITKLACRGSGELAKRNLRKAEGKFKKGGKFIPYHKLSGKDHKTSGSDSQSETPPPGSEPDAEPDDLTQPEEDDKSGDDKPGDASEASSSLSSGPAYPDIKHAAKEAFKEVKQAKEPMRKLLEDRRVVTYEVPPMTDTQKKVLASSP